MVYRVGFGNRRSWVRIPLSLFYFFMIYPGTCLNVIDNSGAKMASCIKILGNKKKGTIGDKIVLSIINLRAKRRAHSKILKGSLSFGIIVRVKKYMYNKNNISFSFNLNSVVLITNQGKPLGSRVFGGVPNLIRYSKYMRIATLSAGILK